MMICSVNYHDVGDTFTISFRPKIREGIHPPQPVVVLRHATKAEYVAYWSASDVRERFMQVIEEEGSPNAPYYYEVSTD